ncbi:MAG: adenylate/guanylate cyclase domain-containing protein [Candidatus Pacebacteria bacterium]|nr:adenylate/guanylate cyclase domain-containing protein [Candidatus Paceibacterota bacterium]
MKSKIYYFIIASLAGVLVCFSFYFGIFSGLEVFFEDLFFAPKPVSGDFVIVSIDDESLSRIGQWPWPREVFAKALLEMEKNTPLAAGMDIVFSELSSNGAEDDEKLASALGKISYPVVLASEAQNIFLSQDGTITASEFIKPLDSFTNEKNVSLGHVNLILDRDNVARKIPFLISEKSPEGIESQMPFAYEIVKKTGKNISSERTLEGVNRIVYSSLPGTIKRIPFWRVLEGQVSGELKDKIVFIGATAPDLHDDKPVPNARGKTMAGVEIQANVANMLIFGYRLVPLGKFYSFLWIFISALFPVIFILLFRRFLSALSGVLILGILYIIFCAVLFDLGVSASVLHISLSWLLSSAGLFGFRHFSGEKDKLQLKRIFSKYVSAGVLEEILSNPKKVALGGEEKEITVLFSDIRGFTSISEKTPPKELVRILNKYFSAMTEEILKQGGVLDKYIGDAIMAFWGAPLEEPDQADNALRASKNMMKRLKILNEEFKAAGDPEINIGIGLCSGMAVVGNVGSEERFDYTAIGDTVNAASRLEGLTKEYQVKIILSESVKAKAKNDYDFKYLGAAAVKGKDEPIKIYTVI